jgi:hypothetical protein
MEDGSSVAREIWTKSLPAAVEISDPFRNGLIFEQEYHSKNDRVPDQNWLRAGMNSSAGFPGVPGKKVGLVLRHTISRESVKKSSEWWQGLRSMPH